MNRMEMLKTGYTRFMCIEDFSKVVLDEELISLLNLPFYDSYDLNCYNNWYKYKGEYYYFKYIDDISVLFNELLGQDFSEWMGLPTVKYDLVVDDEENIIGLVSLNVKDKNKNYVDSRRLDSVTKDYINDIFMGKVEYDSKFQRDLTNYVFRNYFSSLQDRLCNSELIINRDGSFEIPPIMDYTSSYNNHLMVTYLDPLISITITEEVVNDAMIGNRFVSDSLKRMLSYNMYDALLRLEEKYGIVIPNDIKDYYLQFDDYRRCFMLDMNLIPKINTL